MAKDYKANSSLRAATPAGSGALGGLFPYLIILIIGIAIGLINPFQGSHKSKKEIKEISTTTFQQPEERAEAAPVVEPEAVEVVMPKFDFYEMLPAMEVEVQETLQQEADSKVVVSTVPETEKKVPAKIEASYRLQVGAFRTRGEAEQLRAELAFLGLESSIEPFQQTSGSFLHRIKVGPYHNTKEMQKAAATLKLHGFPAIPVS